MDIYTWAFIFILLAGSSLRIKRNEQIKFRIEYSVHLRFNRLPFLALLGFMFGIFIL